jgi:hypothetical protein
VSRGSRDGKKQQQLLECVRFTLQTVLILRRLRVIDQDQTWTGICDDLAELIALSPSNIAYFASMV